MSNLYIQEEFIDKSKGVRYHSSDVLESFTDDAGELYRACVKEYGRCVGKVWISEEKPKHVGWIFEKRVYYDDCDEKFLRETWITVHNDAPICTTKYNFANLK